MGANRLPIRKLSRYYVERDVDTHRFGKERHKLLKNMPCRSWDLQGIIPFHLSTEYPGEEKMWCIKQIIRVASCCLCFFLNPYLSANSEQLPVSIADVMRINNLVEAKMSPDGSQVVFVTATANTQKDYYSFSLWQIDTATGDTRQLTRGPADFNPRWSPDGKSIAFLSGVTGTDQIWLMPANGSRVRKLTSTFKNVQDYCWSPDGKRIAFLAPKHALKKQKKLAPMVKIVGKDDVQNQIFVLDITSQKCQQVTSLNGHVASFSWAPDSQRIVYSLQRSSFPGDLFHQDIYVLDVAKNNSSSLVKREGVDTVPEWSPDGKWIAFISHGGTFRWFGSSSICLVNPESGIIKDLTGSVPNIDSVIGTALEWSQDSNTVYFQCNQGVTSQLFSANIKTHQVQAITSEKHAIRGFSFSKDRSQLVLRLDTPTGPTKLHTSKVKQFAPKCLYHPNPHLDKKVLGKTEVIHWKSKDGLEIEGLLIKPVNYKQGQRYPMITYLHGGPSSAFTMGFIPQGWPAQQMEYLPIQVLAGKGYAVFCPNPRGSDGYGKKFRDAAYKNWHTGPYQDIMSGIDHLVELGIADEKRLGIAGHCYGGYLAAWSISQTDRFKAASAAACMANLETQYAQGDLPTLFEHYFGAEPWNTKGIYRKQSPITHALSIKTPMLLIHGGKDKRVPLAQAQELYAVLKRRDVPVEFVIYPTQGHSVRQPSLQVDSMQRNLAWFDRWLTRPPAKP